MEAADFIESLLKEIFREHVLTFLSSHSVVFFENYVKDFFFYVSLNFLPKLLKNTC